jgi:hypothetical protein
MKPVSGTILASWFVARRKTLNAMLDAEADQLCGAGRYERSPKWRHELPLLQPSWYVADQMQRLLIGDLGGRR